MATLENLRVEAEVALRDDGGVPSTRAALLEWAVEEIEWLRYCLDDIHSLTFARHCEGHFRNLGELLNKIRDQCDEALSEKPSESQRTLFREKLAERLSDAASRPIVAEDWRRIYFGEED